jgi:hypothetical protein
MLGSRLGAFSTVRTIKAVVRSMISKERGWVKEGASFGKVTGFDVQGD